ELTRDFYQRYSDMRQSAFQELARDNPDAPRGDVLAATQKLLDRVLFCAFCEDRGLLPTETIRKAYEHRDPYHPRPIWDNFRGLFDSINGGNAALGIHAYNGGLFAPDPLLDQLRVSDAVCGSFRDLGAYDYRPASQAAQSAAGSSLIDVEILGHIFEQSISDLEKLRSQLSVVSGPLQEEGKEDGLPSPSRRAITAKTPQTARTRRKKEGAFYTPAFITRYIIEQALGGVLKDRFARLRREHEEAAAKKGPARTALADPNVYKLDDLKPAARAALVKFWESWQDELSSIRLLDPACGSGAFLIDAFDQLHAAYQASNDRLQELRGHRTLFDLDKRILENNLYGVDLNEEAIEICRLSLWIKTAERGKVLTSLGHTIRVGNSVVSDPAVHPKAFDWRGEFPEVFAGGGFDVVVGNPPYVRQEWLAPYKPHWEQQFKSYHGTADIFVYFFELGLSILREKGRLAFITSGSWVRSGFGEPLRRYLVGNAAIESIVDFGEFQPFEDAEMIRPSITALQKHRDPTRMRIYKWLTDGAPPENLSDVIAAAPTMNADHLTGGAWELEADDVLSLRRKLAAGGRTLKDYTGGIFRGVTTGANEVFVISTALREELVRKDPKSAGIIKPFVQGTHLRPWYIEASQEHLIFPRRGIAIEDYPAVYEYLKSHREALEPKPIAWPTSRKWAGRKPGSYKWYEIQDSVDYWQNFELTKIVWPDISKLPRFSMDPDGRYLGNTAYIIPSSDYYLLGVLSSWATWFYISKTAQPLRLRGGRWQYRLIAQFMEQVPIPDAGEGDRAAIADLAATCCHLGRQRYELQSHVQRRLDETFGVSHRGEPLGVLNERAQAWWDASLTALGAALKTSYKLASNPLKNPRV
ncbi:MAG TPA: N-6 DNA methylase, partial [Pirellulales bacterium]|nr:N-6 DNA methylase [Pirellulales bacterium]